MQVPGPIPTSGLAAPVRPDWLAARAEPALWPEQPVIDAHHHLWHRPGERYLLEEYAADTNAGHLVEASVYVDCRSMYRASGPEAFRSVGEVEFANGMAAIGASLLYGPTQFCAAIMGSADLRLGAPLRPVLEAMERAGGGRFRGIRQVTAWDEDAAVSRPIETRPPGLMRDPRFHAGFAILAEMGLAFDAFIFHPQLSELSALAAAFPQTRIILDHCGGPVGIGGYATRRAEAFADWRKAIRAIAHHENVTVKLSGLGMRLAGFDFHLRPLPPDSLALAAAWAPYIETCIEAFGVRRCMFASNFPPDKGSCGFVTLWNAFKRLCAGASVEERDALLRGTAAQVYGIAAA